MSLIKSLYHAHGEQLLPSEHDLMARIFERERQLEALISTPSLAHALVHIEPVSFQQGVQLFGQGPNSVACNKLSLYTAKRDASDTHYVPDQHLISVLVSEQTLCHMMLNSNTSDHSPATVVEALGDRLPLYCQSRPTIQAHVAAEIEHHIDDIRRDLQDLMATFEAATERRGLTKKLKEQMWHQLDCIASVSRTDAFYLRRALEGLAKEKSAAQCEVANAISTYFSEIKKATALPCPDQAVSRQSNPLVNALESYYTEEESDLLLKLAKLGIAAFVDKHQLKYDLEWQDPHAQALVRALGYDSRDELKQEAEDLCSLRIDMDNEARRTGRRQDVLQQVVIEVSRRHGIGEPFFSEYGVQDKDTYFVFRMHNAYEESFYGNHSLRTTDNVMEFAMLQEDLMNCLRGYVNGGYTTCTLTYLAGRRVPKVPYHNTSIQAALNNAPIDPKADDVIATVNQIIGRLKQKLDAKVSTKAVKKAIMEDMAELAEIIDAQADVRRTQFGHKYLALSEVVTADLKRQVLQMTKDLCLSHEQTASVLALLSDQNSVNN